MSTLPVYLHLFLHEQSDGHSTDQEMGQHSQAVRIPAGVMEAAHLSLNQPMNVRVENGRVILEPAAPS